MRINYDKDQLAYALANALKERDEAREAFVIATDQMVQAQCKLRESNTERDEAREDLEHWKIEYEIVVSRLCGIKHKRDNGIIAEHEIIPVLRKERDEARDDAQKSKAYKRVLKETNLRQTERIRYLEGATNHACGTPLSVALRERDEARNDIVGWENKWKCAVDMAARAEIERDEALNKLKELKDILR